MISFSPGDILILEDHVWQVSSVNLGGLSIESLVGLESHSHASGYAEMSIPQRIPGSRVAVMYVPEIMLRNLVEAGIVRLLKKAGSDGRSR